MTISTNPGDAGSAAPADNGTAEAPIPSTTRSLGVEVGSAASEVKNYTDIPSAREYEEAAAYGDDDGDDAAPADSAQQQQQQQGADEGNADEGGASEDDFSNPPESFDLNYYQGEFDAKGELSDASYAALEKQGFPRDVVDDYIAMRKEKAEALTKHWTDMMGGEDRKNAIVEWARNSYSEKKRASINKIMSGHDVDAIDIAVQAMVADYERANPTKPPQRQVGLRGTPGSSDVYATYADWQKDVRSERYKKDPEFRAAVQRRAAVSPAVVRGNDR